jgi:hypothetical protein
MSRVKIPITVIDTAGNAVAGASVEVEHRPGGATAIIYQAETGGTTVANPTLTDAFGRVSTWVERGAYVANVTGTGISPNTEPFDAAPAGDDTIDEAWLADAVRRVEQAYTVSGTVDRAINAEATTLTEVARVLATLIADLKTAGLIQP